MKLVNADDMTSSTSVRGTSFSTFQTATTKYNGLVELSPYKKIRNLLFELIRYIYSSVSSSSKNLQSIMKIVNIIMTWIRLLQLFGPSLCISFTIAGDDEFSLWDKNNALCRIFEYFSILWNLVPPNYRVDACPYILLIYSIIFIIFFIIIIGSSVYYKKYAKLPSFVPHIIMIFIGTFGYFFHPVAAAHGFEIIGYYINNSDRTNLVLNIITLICAIICLLIYFWLYIHIFAISIEFRDDSLICILFMPQIQIMVASTLLTAIISLLVHFSSTPKSVGCFLNAAIYIFLFFNRYIEGGFIKKAANIAFATVTTSGAAVSLLCGILLIVKRQMNTSFVFVIIAFVVIMAILMLFYERHRNTKCLIVLDDVSVNNDISNIKSVRQFMSLIVIGFEKAHPVCVDNSIFDLATDKWPKDNRIWCAFLKFLAIYSQFSNQSLLVAQKIQTIGLKGYMIKNMVQQSSSLLKSRDVNLSPELKKKLGVLSKRVQATKHKMRYIWDLVIQGNLNEMDHAIDNCYRAVENCSAEFDHVARQYSNNRFIARSYTRYCHEVLADRQLTNEWFDKSRMLQKGIKITTDAAHDLGLEAFPLLPSNSSGNQLTLNPSENDMSTSEGFASELDEDARNQQSSIQNMLLRNTIEKIKIPSIKYSIVTRLLVLFILFLIPVIVFSIYMTFLIDKLTSPLDFIYTLSYLRCIGFQVAIIGHHYVLEAIPEHLVKHVDPDRDPPVSLGSSFDPRVQLLFLLKTGSSVLQTLSTFASFMEGNPTMDVARDVIFGPNMEYIFFKSRGDRERLNVSLQVGMMDVLNQLYSLLEYTPITDSNPNPENPLNSSVLNTSCILNSVQNAETFGNYILDSLELVIKYMQDKDKEVEKVLMILMISLSILYIFLLILVTALCLKGIRKDKTTIYKCLTALPKNVVSTVVEYLRVLKKDKEDSLMKGGTTTEGDADLNKQEENILKILMTGDSSGGVKSELLIIILTVFHGCAFLAFIIYGGMSVINQSKHLISEAPHVDYLLGAYTYDAATVLATNLMLGEFYNLSTDFLVPVLVTRFNSRLQRSQDYYSRLLYGNKTSGVDINPFKAFAHGLQEAIGRMQCNDISSKPPESVYNAYRCIRPDVMLYIHHNMVLSLVLPVQMNNATISKENELLPEIYDLSLMLLYENFFFPMFNEVVNSLNTTFKKAIVPIIAISFLLFALSLIIEIIIVIINLQTKRHMLFALKMLMQCPINAVHACSNVQRVLSGDFSTSSYEGTARNSEFFDNLVHELPKACIICDQQGIIKISNIASNRMFKSTNDELIGNHIKTLLGNSSPREFNHPQNISKLIEKSVNYTDKSNENINLIVEMRPEQSMVIITFTDVTLTVRYNTLISEEREKSDALLKSILPASLVPRVQRGEKDISFAVQSASVMFTDIVEFTPWCSSNTGPFVMSTLNALFKEFDSRLAKYSTMTKIKCIGDCYMAAGGIFADVNQPAVHASEAVDFGLDQINSVLKCNNVLGTSLRVRVGVNTGGPIVAGVLGIGKPTFEILGPAINMAQQMEHHGVPMNVHISRSVYELIYGGKFKVRERGNIEIKNGTVQTYLVSGDA